MSGTDITIALDSADLIFVNGVYDYTKFEGPKGAKRTSKNRSNISKSFKQISHRFNRRLYGGE